MYLRDMRACLGTVVDQAQQGQGLTDYAQSNPREVGFHQLSDLVSHCASG